MVSYRDSSYDYTRCKEKEEQSIRKGKKITSMKVAMASKSPNELQLIYDQVLYDIKKYVFIL